jgi:hypothetical protein
MLFGGLIGLVWRSSLGLVMRTRTRFLWVEGLFEMFLVFVNDCTVFLVLDSIAALFRLEYCIF